MNTEQQCLTRWTVSQTSSGTAACGCPPTPPGNRLRSRGGRSSVTSPSPCPWLSWWWWPGSSWTDASTGQTHQGVCQMNVCCMLWHRPIGRALGIKDKRKKSPEPNPTLEAAFHCNSRRVDYKSLVTDTGMSDRQINVWMRMRNLAGKWVQTSAEKFKIPLMITQDTWANRVWLSHNKWMKYI